MYSLMIYYAEKLHSQAKTQAYLKCKWELQKQFYYQKNSNKWGKKYCKIIEIIS